MNAVLPASPDVERVRNCFASILRKNDDLATRLSYRGPRLNQPLGAYGSNPMQKTQAVSSLGQHRLMLPAWVKAALFANDRLKVYLTVLQSASSHASHPNRDVPDLGKEIAAAGLNTAWLHVLAAVARRVDDDIYILDLPRLIKCIEDDLETMARSVLETTPPTEEPHRRVQQRLDWLGALAPDRLSDEGFGGERHADHREKRERQHLDRRMAVDELADGLGRDQHHADRCDDGRHRHADLVHHVDRGDARVEREHDVDDGNLADDGSRTWPSSPWP